MIPAVLIPTNTTPHKAITALVGVKSLATGEIYLTPNGWHYVTIVTDQKSGVRSLWIIYSSSTDSRSDVQVAVQVARDSGASRLLIEPPKQRIPYYSRLGFIQAMDYGYGVMEYSTGAISPAGGA